MSPSNEKSSRYAKLYRSSTTLASLIKNRREKLELDLGKVERDTKIRRAYLEYIEDGNYERLPDDIYSRGYVTNYAEYLGLEAAPILLMYKKERALRLEKLKSRGANPHQKIGLTPINNPKLIITPRTFLAVIAATLLTLIVSYLFWQFAGLAAAPKITLDNPDEETITSSIGYVGGRVDGGADVFINDSPILTNGEGAFREQIGLVEGVNQIRVTAKNKLGKSSSVTKTYIANLPEEEIEKTVTTSQQAFDGVQINLRVAGGASWIIVLADDVEIYRGTMLAGSTKTFQAADRLKVSVGNSGNVSVVLTNNQVVGKDLGVIGRPGEIKRDLEFKKDTQTL